MDGQPDLSLSIEDTTQIAPGYGKVRPGLYSLEVARLNSWKEGGERTDQSLSSDGWISPYTLA